MTVAGQAYAQSAGETGVRTFVESFLTRLGDHQLETLDADFAPKATIVVARQRDGQWTSTHQTAEEWLAAAKKNPSPTTFREPITNVKVTVDSDQLAYLRADFQVVREGRVLSSGVDHFTLVRDKGGWKIAMVAYTSIPASK
jgi:ketosteroid isomerase-like protein